MEAVALKYPENAEAPFIAASARGKMAEKTEDKKIFSKKNGALPSLMERLSTPEKQINDKSSAGYLRGLFLIKRDEIENAIKCFSKKRVWAVLNRDGEFPGSYTTFLVMIKKYIELSNEEEKNQQILPIQKEDISQKEDFSKIKAPRHFHHNPSEDIDW